MIIVDFLVYQVASLSKPHLTLKMDNLYDPVMSPQRIWLLSKSVALYCNMVQCHILHVEDYVLLVDDLVYTVCLQCLILCCH